VRQRSWVITFERNFGNPTFYYNGVREKLPLEIIAGVSQELENVPIRWHLTLENVQQWNIAFFKSARTTSSLMENQPKRKFHL
jgi:hypothetical protein